MLQLVEGPDGRVRRRGVAVSLMIGGRRADSARRRERAVKALNEAIKQGDSLSVSAIARWAGVDRTFFYRHRDLPA